MIFFDVYFFLCLVGGSWVVVVVTIYPMILHTSLSFILVTLCHYKSINGFNIISHNPSIEDVKEILAKKITEDIVVYTGPGHIWQGGESEFEEQCTVYFDRYFEILANEDCQILPWKTTNKFILSMAHWLEKTNKCSTIKGLVLHSFSIFEYICQLGFTSERLQDFTQIGSFSQAPSIVVYNPRLKFLLLLRKAQSKKLVTDIESGFNDLKLFILSFHDVLRNSGMKLTHLVVTDDKVNLDNHDCDLCMNHVLSEKDLPDFGNWLEGKESYFRAGSGKEVNQAFSKRFSAKLVGVLAATRIHPNCIPILTDNQDDHQHMKNLAVLLTPAQMDVYYAQEKHMIIKGGFGCGKSIIAVAMLRKIANSLGEGEQLFYVCYDSRSELLNKMVKNDQKKNKVTPLHNKNGRKLSAIIKDITKSEGSKKINIVVDEYNGEDLDESEAERLNEIITESFKETFVVLIPQPIEKERFVNEIYERKNRFDILKKTMTTHYLTLNMRNSIEIHELVEATKEVLKEEKTFFFAHPEDIEPSDESEASKDMSPYDMFKLSKLAQGNEDYLDYRDYYRDYDEKQLVTKMGLDEAQAIVGSPKVESGGRNITESKFRYAEVDKTGHQISTERPVLVELGDKEDFDKNLSLVAIFERWLPISRRKHVVLHFDNVINAIPSPFSFAFDQYFKTHKITTNYKEFQLSGKSVLVCSYLSFRGLECPRITVLIDRDIYFIQHFLVEALARCTSELKIIVLKNSSTLTKVIREWKAKKLVIQWKTDIFKKEILREDYKINIDAEHNTMKATFRFEYYKKLEEAFILDYRNDDIPTIEPITQRAAKKTIGQR